MRISDWSSDVCSSDLTDARLDIGEFGRADQIGLVQHDYVGEGDLFFRLAAVLQPRRQMAGIDHGDDGIELGAARDVFINGEGLRHRPRIGQPGGLDADPVETVLALHQRSEASREGKESVSTCRYRWAP